MKYYAVRKGRQPGIYKTWEECKDQVIGFKGAEYKKFNSEEEAKNFIGPGEISIKPTGGKALEELGELEDKEIKSLGDKEAVAYVDGSFDLASFTYSYGVVYFNNKEKRNFSGRDDDEDLSLMRNVSGELKAAMEAMKIAVEDGREKLYLHYDYMGIEKWALGHWKTNKNGTKKYKEFYDEISKRLEVVFVKVRAHSGVKYNEEADKLAKDAL